jgi:hypothetical protein
LGWEIPFFRRVLLRNFSVYVARRQKILFPVNFDVLKIKKHPKTF